MFTQSNKSINIFTFLLIFVPLFLISSFRNGLGTDYYAYAEAYNNSELFKSEYIFRLIFIQIPRLISDNEILFFILTSFVVCYFFIKAIFKESPIVFLSTLIFVTQFYFISYNAIRQFIAISIFIYFGKKILYRNRLLLYFLFVLMLSQIHYSMYLLVLFPLLGRNDFRIKTYWYIWIISLLLFVCQVYNIANFSNLFWFAPKLVLLSNKFDQVLSGSIYFFDLYQSNNQLIIKNILFLILLSRIRFFKGTSQIYWFNLFLFCLVIHNILVKFSVFAVRLSYVGDVALIFIVPFFIKTFKIKSNRIILSILFAAYFIIIFYYRFVVNGESDVFTEGQWLTK